MNIDKIFNEMLNEIDESIIKFNVRNLFSYLDKQNEKSI